MTENEAIKRMRYRLDTVTNIAGKGIDGKSYEDVKMATKALEEIQQYRAIGTVEGIKEILQIISEGQDDVDESGIITGLLHALLEYAEYKKIGTVEECREARERKRVKDIIHNPNGRVDEDWLCPLCGRFCSPYTEHCQHCGQAVKVGDNP